ncbi:BLUF domain-containing protein [Thiorhodococcus mannitoliphagus]|uniref:BLUF domain-containing protein n=1 Tax=Thiorhodococcus mannitoliphagus TaxID=329406 RepID=A0A6P1DPX0_9GAMM|nr:BLUF domain-containing protein [Thiorhodococcus mannitoliphagus]NEX20058.1 BLUF domain-containing protein [Thiorhodococcus mannitoliphagus]
MNHCRLIYRSTCTDKFMANEELRDLVEKSAENNRKLSVTGLLVLSGDQFLQVLEGPVAAVNDLYAHIVQDSRHHHPRLISYEPTEEIYFDDWGMSIVDLYDLPKAVREILIRKYSSKEDAVEFPERLHEVYAFLLDAKIICQGRPWEG